MTSFITFELFSKSTRKIIWKYTSYICFVIVAWKIEGLPQSLTSEMFAYHADEAFAMIEDETDEIFSEDHPWTIEK